MKSTEIILKTQYVPQSFAEISRCVKIRHCYVDLFLVSLCSHIYVVRKVTSHLFLFD